MFNDARHESTISVRNLQNAGLRKPLLSFFLRKHCLTSEESTTQRSIEKHATNGDCFSQAGLGLSAGPNSPVRGAWGFTSTARLGGNGSIVVVEACRLVSDTYITWGHPGPSSCRGPYWTSKSREFSDPARTVCARWTRLLQNAMDG